MSALDDTGRDGSGGVRGYGGPGKGGREIIIIQFNVPRGEETTVLIASYGSGYPFCGGAAF